MPESSLLQALHGPSLDGRPVATGHLNIASAVGRCGADDRRSLQLRFRPQLNSRNLQVPRSNKIAKVKCRRLESPLSRERMAYPKNTHRENSHRRGNGIDEWKGLINNICTGQN